MCANKISYMGLTRVAVAAVLCVAVLPARAAFAQSLADVARRTEEQRKAATSKVYTNDNVAPSDQPSAPPGAAPAAAPGEQTPLAGVEQDKAPDQTRVEPAPVESRRNEQYWQKVLAEVRAKIEALTKNIASQQARLDAIEGDSPTAVREREVISTTIERLQKDVALQNGELTRWLTLAKTTKVPEEWLK